MTEISIDGKEYRAPSAWAELTEKQLITWMKVCAKNVQPDMALMFISCVFCGMKEKLYLKLNAAQRVQLADQFKYLLENKLSSWKIPLVKIGFNTFIGPSDYLSTSTIKEFSTAESYYHAYLVKKDEAMLDQLIATLYRPASESNNGKDLRKNLTEVDVLANAPKMEKLDAHLRAAILFNYEGCRLSLMARYPSIFLKGDGTPSNKLPDLSTIISTIAGGKFGHYKETEHTDLYLFLDHWKDDLEAAERAKQDANRK